MLHEQRFKPSNQLTFDTVPPDCERLLKLLMSNDNATTLQLDLHDVTQCDSAGLALIIEAKRLCKQYNKTLTIEGVSKAIYALADFCGLEAMLSESVAA